MNLIFWYVYLNFVRTIFTLHAPNGCWSLESLKPILTAAPLLVRHSMHSQEHLLIETANTS